MLHAAGRVEIDGRRLPLKFSRTFVAGAVSVIAGAAVLGAPPRDPGPVARALIEAERMKTEIPHRLDAPSDSLGLGIPRSLGEIILWAGVILGALLIGYALRDSLPGWDRSRRLQGERQSAEDDTAAAPTLHGARREAEGLAAAGRFDEAMHVLLLRAVAELRDTLKLTIADSLTAREIERRAPLDGGGKTAFGRMVHAVERVVFGQRAPTSAPIAPAAAISTRSPLRSPPERADERDRRFLAARGAGAGRLAVALFALALLFTGGGGVDTEGSDGPNSYSRSAIGHRALFETLSQAWPQRHARRRRSVGQARRPGRAGDG